MSTFADELGRATGALLAPLTGGVAALRRARMFHPEGVTWLARTTAAATSPDLEELADRLAGPVLTRFSSAWWRGGKEWPDVLGTALRFLDEDVVEPSGRAVRVPHEPRGADQDVLFATIRSPWTTPLAPLATRTRSFLWNHYHAVSPFSVVGMRDIGRIKLRLRSPRLMPPRQVSRVDHLAAVTARGDARFTLEVRRLSRSLLARRWEPLLELRLERPALVDQEALRFWPFRFGRGIEPVGFVQHLRLGAYAASQAARPLRSEAPFDPMLHPSWLPAEADPALR
ncbi:MAG: hypothetical protein WKG00_23500 [Polyangiaceae bacterium]